MISVVIPNVNDQRLVDVRRNVAATIGVEHEFVVVPNHDGKMGLCAAYNVGATRAKYPFLCFMHEDVLIHTPNWGEKIIEILGDKQIGLLGVLGTVYKSKAPSGVWCYTGESVNRGCYYYFDKKGAKQLLNQNPANTALEDVVALDGLWLCTRQSVWQEIPFDQQTFTGFHMYDVDYSAEIAQHFRVCITYEILMEHFSRGGWTRDWLDSVEAYSRKWQTQLPMSVETVSAETVRELEYRRYIRVAKFLINEDLRRQRGVWYAVNAIRHQPLRIEGYRVLSFLLLGKTVSGWVSRLKQS